MKKALKTTKIMSWGIGIVLCFLLLAHLLRGPDARGYELLKAASNGNLIEVVFLVESGTNIDYTSRKVSTALASAALNGHLLTVKYLLFKGADYKLDGRVNSSWADQTGPNEAIKLVRSKMKPGEKYFDESFIPINNPNILVH